MASSILACVNELDYTYSPRPNTVIFCNNGVSVTLTFNKIAVDIGLFVLTCKCWAYTAQFPLMEFSNLNLEFNQFSLEHILANLLLTIEFSSEPVPLKILLYTIDSKKSIFQLDLISHSQDAQINMILKTDLKVGLCLKEIAELRKKFNNNSHKLLNSVSLHEKPLAEEIGLNGFCKELSITKQLETIQQCIDDLKLKHDQTVLDIETNYKESHKDTESQKKNFELIDEKLKLLKKQYSNKCEVIHRSKSLYNYKGILSKMIPYQDTNLKREGNNNLFSKDPSISIEHKLFISENAGLEGKKKFIPNEFESAIDYRVKELFDENIKKHNLELEFSVFQILNYEEQLLGKKHFNSERLNYLNYDKRTYKEVIYYQNGDRYEEECLSKNESIGKKQTNNILIAMELSQIIAITL